jgi:hypothetical protein
MDQYRSVLAALASYRILLKQDKTLPSVVGIVTGESLHSSWWAHPKAHLIFAILEELGEHPDILFTKLLYHKHTLVHRDLWPSLLAVGSAGEAWQLQGLSTTARDLLSRIDQSANPLRATGAAVKEIEWRLLATAQQFHSESGRHEIRLESWTAWSFRVGCVAASSVSDARQSLEEATVTFGAPLKALPWHHPRPAA